MRNTGLRRYLMGGLLIVLCGAASWGQTRPMAAFPTAGRTVEPPDSERARQDLSNILEHYPPELRRVLQLDPGLLQNGSYLGSYPSLAAFLSQHPEVARNPVYYVGSPGQPRNTSQEMWENVLAGLAVFLGFAMAFGLLTWLVRTWIDYRRWSRLYKVQTEVHTKILDRFAGNEELLSYIQTPAGSKFLESAPISLEAGPRSVAAPMGRILWSVQAGVVLAAAGIGLKLIGMQIRGDASQPFGAMGLLAMALGLGFALSAIISYVISRRLGLIEHALPRAERPNGQA
ncbi:MAG TPA: hypothetical protein VMU19_10465 [Bryobacteraceae bacterium]|nr:hypothetical protein [Bryobacteraceae bacterium]